MAPTSHWASKNSAGPYSALHHFYTLLCSQTHPAMGLWNLCTFPPACLPGCPRQPVLLLVLLTSLGSTQERKPVLPLCSDSTHLSQVSVTILIPVLSSGNPGREPHSLSGVRSVCSPLDYTYLEHFSLLEYGSFTYSVCSLSFLCE